MTFPKRHQSRLNLFSKFDRMLEFYKQEKNRLMQNNSWTSCSFRASLKNRLNNVLEISAAPTSKTACKTKVKRRLVKKKIF